MRRIIGLVLARAASRGAVRTVSVPNPLPVRERAKEVTLDLSLPFVSYFKLNKEEDVKWVLSRRRRRYRLN